MKKHIAITGATGFLGRNVLGDFLKDGHVERLYLLSRRREWPDNLTKFRGNPKLTLIEGDVEDPMVVKDPKKRRNLQHIVTELHHLVASTKFHEREREETMRTNYDGTLNVIRLLNGARSLKRFVYVSTLYVGNVLQAPIIYEDTELPRVGLVEPYQESKWMAEKAVRESRLPWTIIRPGVFSGDSFDGDSGYDYRTGYGITLGILHAAIMAHPELGGGLEDPEDRIKHYLKWREAHKDIKPADFFDVNFRLDGYPHITKNVMSMNDIVAQNKAIIGSEIDTIHRTYHVATKNPLTAQEWIDSICYALRFKGVGFGGSLKNKEWEIGKMPEDPRRPWTKEELRRRKIAERVADAMFNQHYSRAYFVRPDPFWDTKNTDHAIQAYNARFPDDQIERDDMTVPKCRFIMDQWVENELPEVNRRLADRKRKEFKGIDQALKDDKVFAAGKPAQIMRPKLKILTNPSEKASEQEVAKFMEELTRYVKQFGNGCMAYSALQPGMRYHFAPGIGFIAYSQAGPITPEETKASELRLRMKRELNAKGVNFNLEDRTTTHVLSDPIASSSPRARDGLRTLVDSFIGQHPQACFWQTSSEFSDLLLELGYSKNQMGIETRLNLDAYTPPSKIRYAVKQPTDRGIALGEVNPDEFDWRQAREISDRWIQTKAVKQELAFLARPMEYRKEEDVRIFAAHQGKRVLGFVVYSPIYQDGKVTGYMEDILRAAPDATSGLCDALNVKAIERFKLEGKKVLSLGLSPFYKVDDVERKSNDSHVMMGPIFRDMYEKHNDIYDSPALSKHKEQYSGEQVKVFFNTRDELPAEQILGGLRLSRVF